MVAAPPPKKRMSLTTRRSDVSTGDEAYDARPVPSKLTGAKRVGKTLALPHIGAVRARGAVTPRFRPVDRQPGRRHRPGDSPSDAVAPPAARGDPLGLEARPRSERERHPRRAEGVRPADAGRGHARRGDRSRQDPGARSERRLRRLRRAPQRRGRGATRCIVHARTQQARGRRRMPREHQDAVGGREAGAQVHEQRLPCGRGRQALRAVIWIQGRRPPHRAIAPEMVGVARQSEPDRRLPRRAGIGEHGGPAHRDDQLQRRDAWRRDLVGHDDLRPRLEDPGSRRRFGDDRSRAIHGQRDRRGGLDGPGGIQHQGLWRVPHGGVHAPRHEADRRVPRNPEARHGDHGTAAARRPRPAQVRIDLLRGEQAGRVRGCRAVSGQLRGARRHRGQTARRGSPVRERLTRMRRGRGGLGLMLAALALAPAVLTAQRAWVDQLYPYAYYSTIDGFWLAGRYGWYSPMGFTERPEPNFASLKFDAGASTKGSYLLSLDASAPAYWDGWRFGVTLTASRANRLGYYGQGNSSPYDADSVTPANPYFYRVSRTTQGARLTVQRRVVGPL